MVDCFNSLMCLLGSSPPKQAVKSYFEQKYHENIRPTRASLKNQSQAGKNILAE